MTTTQTRRTAAALMTLAAALAIAGFSALGSIFDYPKVLKLPTAQILSAYQAHHAAVSGWFLILTVGALLMAPLALLLSRLAIPRLATWIAGVGVAGAIVQAVGLSRWVLFVPGLSRDAQVPGRRADATHTFETLHHWLGTVLGETVGYALTATFTVLVVRGVVSRLAPRWVGYLGYAAAALVATGVLIPLGVPGTEQANFIGYVAWCVWLLVLAAVLGRGPRDRPGGDSRGARGRPSRGRGTDDQLSPSSGTPAGQRFSRPDPAW